jgi:hypothetical protein
MGFDNRFVLFKSVNTVSIVMFCGGEMGILVSRCVPPVLFTGNPMGKEVVFSNEPSEEYTFITALIF